jgi:hypothetical protein
MLTLNEKLKGGLGKRTIVILDVYPFFIVGTLCRVMQHYIEVEAEFGVLAELMDLPFRIRTDNIVGIYSETVKGEIPFPEGFASRIQQTGGGNDDTAISH